MSFVRSIEVPLGQPVTIPATTIHVERDSRGDSVYRTESGPGTQGTNE